MSEKMQREIKFRIWDSERRKMYYLLEDRFSFGTCENDRAVSWEDVFAEQHPELIPLQYTGHRDKNGKEIYDGDYLLTPTGSILRVSWSQDWAMFTVNGDRVGSLMWWYSNSEVIGNIYEE